MAKGKPGGGQQGGGQKQQQKAKPEAQADGQQHYTSYIQVLATDIDHNSPSLLLFLDREGRLLFNAGEGLQRLFRESKVKMQKLETYMFTRVSTETVSGLPGMLLSSGAGMGATSLTAAGDAGGLLAPAVNCSLFGPSGLAQYVHAFKPYINQEQTLSVHELGVGGEAPAPIKRSILTITPLVLRPQGQQHAAASTEAVASAGTGDGEPSAKRLKVEDAHSTGAHGAAAGAVEPRWPGTLDEAVAEKEAVAYVCEFAGTPGKFDPARARALGLTPGPAYGRLQRGQAVKLADGTVIEPQQVMDPPCPGPLVVVLDVPSDSHLAALEGEAGRQLLAPWLSAEAHGAAGDRLAVIAHLSPARVSATPRYHAWMRSLGSSTRHLLCALQPGATQVVTLRRATMLQAKLNCLHPRLFPMLHHTTAPAPPSVVKVEGVAAQGVGQEVDAGMLDVVDPPVSVTGTGTAAPSPAPGSNAPIPQALAARSGLKLHLAPIKSQGLDVAEVGPEGVDEAAMRAELAAAAPQVLERARGMDIAAPRGAGELPAGLQGIGRDVAEVVFLGTASSQPSKYRNVTALYVDCAHRGGLLLDCGEDTAGQLKRRYGVAGAEERIQALHCVWVSHMHADHHGGLYRLLELRARLMGRNATPLLIVGPWPLFSVLQAYQRVVPLPFHFLPNTYLLHGGSTHRPPPDVVLRAFKEAQAALGLTIQPFAVTHIAHACGVVLRGAEGRPWSVVFSGDTRPCRNLVEAARGCSLLIHEATFEDEMAEDAARKKHSTTGEALAMGEQAGAYRVILTHFSTRYPTLPEMDLSAHPRVACATDFMSINLADLHWLPSVMQPLGALFNAEREGWEQDEGGAGPLDPSALSMG